MFLRNGDCCWSCPAGYVLECAKAIAESPPAMHGYRASQGHIPSPGISSAVLPPQQRTAANSVLAHTGPRRPVVQAPMEPQPRRAHGKFACRPPISARGRRAPQKNNNPVQLMADGSEGHVMVQRTDIAGNVRCSMGQVSPGDGGLCRRAPINALIAKSYFSEPLPAAHFGGNNRCRLFTTAVPRSMRSLWRPAR